VAPLYQFIFVMLRSHPPIHKVTCFCVWGICNVTGSDNL